MEKSTPQVRHDLIAKAVDRVRSIEQVLTTEPFSISWFEGLAANG